MCHQREVDDEPAGGGAKQVKELLAQGGCACDVEGAAQDGDNVAPLSPGRESPIVHSVGDAGHHAGAFGPAPH